MKSRPLDIVVAGLAVVDVIGRPVHFAKLPKPGGLQLLDSVTLTTGGNVSNFGIDLVKLGFRVGAITRVGDDGLGEFLQREYAFRGMDTSGVIVDRRAQTSATLVAVGKDGERTFLHTRGCLANFRARDVIAHLPLIAQSRIFAMGYLGLLPECEPELPGLFRTIKKETGVSILLDTGGTPRKNFRLLKAMLPFVDYFIPSYEEAVAITGKRNPADITDFLFAAGAPHVTGVKLGAKGCYIACADCSGGVLIPAARVRRVVDSTGAGDAFIAGFLAATLKGFDPCAAASVGNAVAASCVTAIGASTAIRPFTSYVRP